MRENGRAEPCAGLLTSCVGRGVKMPSACPGLPAGGAEGPGSRRGGGERAERAAQHHATCEACGGSLSGPRDTAWPSAGLPSEAVTRSQRGGDTWAPVLARADEVSAVYPGAGGGCSGRPGGRQARSPPVERGLRLGVRSRAVTRRKALGDGGSGSLPSLLPPPSGDFGGLMEWAGVEWV